MCNRKALYPGRWTFPFSWLASICRHLSIEVRCPLAFNSPWECFQDTTQPPSCSEISGFSITIATFQSLTSIIFVGLASTGQWVRRWLSAMSTATHILFMYVISASCTFVNLLRPERRMNLMWQYLVPWMSYKEVSRRMWLTQCLIWQLTRVNALL